MKRPKIFPGTLATIRIGIWVRVMMQKNNHHTDYTEFIKAGTMVLVLATKYVDIDDPVLVIWSKKGSIIFTEIQLGRTFIEPIA